MRDKSTGQGQENERGGVARSVKHGKFLDCSSNSANRAIPLYRT
jgi:hypothetical protein